MSFYGGYERIKQVIMTKQEFLSASLPYKIHLSRDGKKDGGRLRDIRVSNVIDLNGCRLPDRYNVRVGSKSIYYNNIENYIPIVRPLTDLTKPIVQANYNNGKPFVPIVELNKLFNPYDGMELVYYINSGLGWRIDSSRCNTAITFDMMIKPIKQLFIWHFDLITEDCEKVYVTDEFNPYK